MTKIITAKKGITRNSFVAWGRIAGKKSVKTRFAGKTKKEISEIMKKVSLARNVSK